MVALNISFHSSRQHTLNLKKTTKTKKKYGGRVSIQAADSDLHSRDGPPSNRFCRDTEAKLRQQTRDAQILPRM
jgi:hypothetical protein